MRIATGILAILAALVLAAPARADLTLTRESSFYGVFDPEGVDQTTTATVDLQVLAPDRAFTRAATNGQTYTFESTVPFAAAVPKACARSANALRVVCSDIKGTDADVGEISMKGQGGNDRLTVNLTGVGNVSADLSGGPGDDVLTGTRNADSLHSGGGADTLIGRAGADGFFCDDTGAVVSYDDGRSSGITMTLTGNASTQSVPDGDNFVGTCRSFAGTKYADTFTGYSANEAFDGQAGNDDLNGLGGDDVLTGGPGNDKLNAGAGADTVRAADGVADTVDCGPDADKLTSDAVDTVANCETADSQPQPTPVPTAEPTSTATATPSSTPAPDDEDDDGKATVKAKFDVHKGYTQVEALSVRHVADDSDITLECRQKRDKDLDHEDRSCAFSERDYDSVDDDTLNLKGPFHNRHLKLRTFITVTVEEPDGDDQEITYRTRRNKAPVRTSD